MNREILFRGKNPDYNEWVYGGAVHQTDFYGQKCDKWFIVDGTCTLDYAIGDNIEVLADTVCQYTGLLDKNGQKIFEGDILLQKPTKKFKKINPDDWECYGLVEYGECDYRPDWHGYRSIGFFIKPIKSISLNKNRIISNIQRGLNQYDLVSENYPFEVIGNIVDNPELLEVVE